MKQAVVDFDLVINGKPLCEIINAEAGKWHNFFVRENVPIYHYTSQSGLEGILSSNSLWFSDVEALNDSSEGKYLYSLLSNVLNDYQDNGGSFKAFKQQIFDCIININRGEIFNSSNRRLSCYDDPHYFICSFCENNDALNMWQYYTKSENRVGYNIEFYLNDLWQSIKKSSDLFDFLNLRAYRVLYRLEEQRELLKHTIKFFYEIWNDSLHKDYVLKGLAEYLYVIKFALKHPAFEQEKEIRIIGKTGRDNFNNALTAGQIKIRSGNDMYIPYISVAFDKNMIKQIKASPLTNNYESVKYVLQKYNYVNVKVGKSNIPLRY